MQKISGSLCRRTPRPVHERRQQHHGVICKYEVTRSSGSSLQPGTRARTPQNVESTFFRPWYFQASLLLIAFTMRHVALGAVSPAGGGASCSRRTIPSAPHSSLHAPQSAQLRLSQQQRGTSSSATGVHGSGISTHPVSSEQVRTHTCTACMQCMYGFSPAR